MTAKDVKWVLYAPTFDKKLQRMLERDFSHPNFPTKHLMKDTGLFITEAESVSLDISSIEGVRKVLAKALDQALADYDYSSLYNAVNPDESLANLTQRTTS